MRDFIKTSVIAIVALLIGGQTMYAETKRALLVGISDYGNAMEDIHKWPNIHGANDIPLLTPLLEDQNYSIKSLVDSQATYVEITNALSELINECCLGDSVYLHFSMHGQPFEDLNGDEEDGWDEALIPVDAEMLYAEGVYEGKNHLLDDELEVYFNDIRTKLGPEGQLVVVLDACHSGTASRGDDELVRGTKSGFTRSGKLYEPDQSQETNDYFVIETKEGQSQVIIVEACRAYEVNNEYYDTDTQTVFGSLSFYTAQAIIENNVIGSTPWIEAIKYGMKNSKRKRVRKQNVVIEKSE